MGGGGAGVANGSGSVALLESAPQEQELATPSEPAVGTCIVVIQRYRLFKQRHGLGSRLRHQDVHIGNGAQNEVVGVEIVSLSMIFDGIRRIFRSRYAMVFVLFPSSMLPG